MLRKFAVAAIAALSFTALAAPASAAVDPLSALQGFTLADVQQAQAIYAANPSVPTYAAATQCLGWMNATLSKPNAGLTINLSPIKGVASGIADLDVALNTANNGLPPIVLAFNQNCGGYIEDLKAEAAQAVANKFNILGITF